MRDQEDGMTLGKEVCVLCTIGVVATQTEDTREAIITNNLKNLFSL